MASSTSHCQIHLYHNLHTYSNKVGANIESLRQARREVAALKLFERLELAIEDKVTYPKRFV